MKPSIISFLLLILTAFPGMAQSIPEPPDTIKTINSPESVIVSRSGETTVIEVVESNKVGQNKFAYEVTVSESSDSDSDPMIDFEIPFGIGKSKEPKTKKKLHTSGFLMGNVYVGQCFNYSDKGNVKNSFELGIRNLIGIRWSHGAYTPSFSIGFGYGVVHRAAQRGFMYTKDGSSLILTPTEDGYRVRLTDLTVCKFQIPLMVSLPIGKSLEFQAGAIACFNTYAEARTELDFGNYKTKTTYKGLQQRLFTAEFTASLGLCDILGVYASWSPMPLFKAPYGPQLKSWSIGLTVNL